MSLIYRINKSKNKQYLSRVMKHQQNGMCAQRRFRSAWAFAQSDQSLHYPHEESFGPQIAIKRTAKTLIRLGGCPGWSESSLGAHAILLVLSWGGSFVKQNCNNLEKFRTQTKMSPKRTENKHETDFHLACHSYGILNKNSQSHFNNDIESSLKTWLLSRKDNWAATWQNQQNEETLGP